MAGPRELLVGRALASLLQARDAYGNEFDDEIVKLLAAQCRGVALPPGLQVERAQLEKFFPMKELLRAKYAFCGSFILLDGRTVVANGFPTELAH